jgi:8-oxo-dGTP pyrophosphatase MutT (NUDIX family)
MAQGPGKAGAGAAAAPEARGAPRSAPSLSGRRPAAVLVPIYDGPGGPTVLLIRRTAVGVHSGQVAFPGGRPEPGDRDLEETALREAEEELGIPRDAVRVVGRLPVVETIVSNYAIHAFVGRLRARPVLRLQASEVAGVLDVPLAELLREPLEEWWDLPAAGGRGPERRLVRFHPWGDDRIWGATQRMVEHLAAAVREGQLSL